MASDPDPSVVGTDPTADQASLSDPGDVDPGGTDQGAVDPGAMDEGDEADDDIVARRRRAKAVATAPHVSDRGAVDRDEDPDAMDVGDEADDDIVVRRKRAKAVAAAPHVSDRGAVDPDAMDVGDEADDDIVARRKRARTVDAPHPRHLDAPHPRHSARSRRIQRAATRPAVRTQGPPDAMDVGDEADDDIVAWRQRRAKAVAATPRAHAGPRWLIVAALLVGVATGAWFAGRYSARPDPDPTASASVDAGQATADTAAREAELRATLAQDPDDVDALLELGVLVFEEGDYAEAGELWRHVTDLDPDQPEAWFNLGFYHLSVEPTDVAAARAAWAKVIELAPDTDMATTAQAHLTNLAEATPAPTEGGAATGATATEGAAATGGAATEPTATATEGGG
ncbi:MAG: hypothetical protein LBS56_10505 [Propionibacteriaceae bacterium]|jgi:cytochrome c-type biogenesis protein CcmH/NrfG|nr:hypothetical protein [Propionibacteriaceae bacterium]